MTNPPPSKLAVLPACKEALEMLHEEPGFLFIAKPPGLLSVPGRNPKNWDCVISRLEGQYPSVSAVHRLDFDTSGVMVVSLSKFSHRAIAKQFQERETQKVYTAVVAGKFSSLQGIINAPIAPDAENRPKCKVCKTTGKEAITHYEVVSFNEDSNTSRVLLTPKTGRSHQLRLHLSHIGHPILGCDFYAPTEVREAATRLLLHATSLSFAHPETKKPTKGVSPCPF